MGAGLWPWHQVRTQLPQPKPTPSPSRQPGDHPEESMAAMVSHVDAFRLWARSPAETCPYFVKESGEVSLPPAPFPICDLGPLLLMQPVWFSPSCLVNLPWEASPLSG